MEEQHLSLSEAAGALNISERTARRWIKSGKLRAYKPGRDYWIPESAVKEVVEESEVRPKAASRSLLEPTFNHVLEDERQELSSGIDAVGAYVRRRAEEHRKEVRASESPYFRNATIAALWAEMVNREIISLSKWVWEHLGDLMPTATIGDDWAGEKMGSAAEAGLAMFQVVDEARARIATMDDTPDDLAARRLEQATSEAKASTEGWQDLGKAANG